MAQLLYLYMTTGEKKQSFDYTDLCQQTDVSGFNMLSRFVITFFPRNKRLLISQLQSLSGIILETRKRKIVPASTFPPSIWLEVMGSDALVSIFFFSCWHPPLKMWNWDFPGYPNVLASHSSLGNHFYQSHIMLPNISSPNHHLFASTLLKNLNSPSNINDHH